MKTQKTKVTVILTSLLTMILLVVFLGCSGGGGDKKSDPAQSQKEATPAVKQEAAKKPLVDDFRGIKWFTKKSEIPGFAESFVLYYDYPDSQTSVWEKKDENKSMGNIPLDYVRYTFCYFKEKGGDGKFCKVDFSFDRANYDNVVSFLNQSLGAFGAQTSVTEPPENKYVKPIIITTTRWDLPSIRVEVSNGHCTIEPKKEKSKTGGGL